MQKHLQSGGRYPVLRAVAILYLIGACVTLIGGLIATGYAAFTMSSTVLGRLSWLGLGIGGTFLSFIAMLGVAEVIKLFIDMEHSMRCAAVSNAMRETTVATPASVTTGGDGARNRIATLDEETAESALIRGHY
ncbi:MAG TPA: hypothetical protein VIL86_12425 [Tepidisphaeraceae bacterium]|jgi:hypothetical protein